MISGIADGIVASSRCTLKNPFGKYLSKTARKSIYTATNERVAVEKIMDAYRLHYLLSDTDSVYTKDDARLWFSEFVAFAPKSESKKALTKYMEKKMAQSDNAHISAEFRLLMLRYTSTYLKTKMIRYFADQIQLTESSNSVVASVKKYSPDIFEAGFEVRYEFGTDYFDSKELGEFNAETFDSDEYIRWAFVSDSSLSKMVNKKILLKPYTRLFDDGPLEICSNCTSMKVANK